MAVTAAPGEFLGSGMFGHWRGAFTGVVREKPGLLETPDGDTFFLDELENMVEQLVIFAEPDGEIPPEDLPLGEREPSPDDSGDAEQQPFVNRMVEFGRTYHEARERVIERFGKEYLSRKSLTA